MKKVLFSFFLLLLSLKASALPGDYSTQTIDVDNVRYMLLWTNWSKQPVSATVIANENNVYSGDIVIRNTISYPIDDSKTLEFKVMYITRDAFVNCDQLTSVFIPSNVSEIGYKESGGWSSVIIGGDMVFYNPFKGCSNLQCIQVEEGNENYDSRDNCNAVIDTKTNSLIIGCKKTSIPNGIKTIGAYSFYGCGELKNVTLPESVNCLQSGAFIGCSISDFYCDTQTAPYIQKRITEFGGGSIIFNDEVFDETISNTILHVKDYAIESFLDNEDWGVFKEIVCDERVTDFNLNYYVDGELYKTYKHKYEDEIVPEPSPVKEGYTFSGWSEIPSVMPGKDVNVYGTLTANKYKLNYYVDGELYKSYTIPYDSATIKENEPLKEDFEFSGWSEIPQTMPAKDVDITGSFTRIAVTVDNVTYTFDGDNAIVTKDKGKNGEVVIASTVESDGKTYSIVGIAENVFKDNANITAVTIPDGVTSIGEYAFNGCKNIRTISISSGIKSIGTRAFANIDKLSDVTVSAADVPETDRTAFENSYLDYVTLHVPYGSVDKYKAIGPWKDFKEIVVIEGTQRTFVLTYKVDGEVYKSYEVKEGEAITPEPEPTKEGYTFSGWSEIPAVMPSEDLTITGTFTINKYKLTYIVDDKDYKVFEVEYNAAITPEPAPEKEGYTFSGWSEIPEKMPAKDVTVTGTFIINKYKLVYKVDNSVYNESEVVYGAAITPEPAPTKEGYTFSGWSEIPETMPAHDVTVTGTFTINKYKLTYMVDGEVYKTYDVEYGATITPEAEPTKEGYSFSGWSEIPETMPAKDVTVAGEFTVNKYKLTYEVDGSEYKSYDVEFGATITPEEEPTKEGYTFSGWSTIPETMPAHDVTITGSFTKGAYKLIYKIDGEVYKTYTYDFGAEITPEPAPEKEGYTFSGWSDIPTTMPANDVEVTGSFAVNKYNLIYKVDGEVYKEYEMEYGAEITREEEPTKEGWEFSGWSWIPKKMPAEDVIITGTFTQIEYDVDGNKYVINDDEATIVDGGDAEGEVVIDATITINGKTYKVTVIGEGAYQGNDKITSVDISDGIETILANAFLNCGGINTLKIGKTIKNIGSKAFGNIWTSAVGRRASDNLLTIECHAESVPEADTDCFDGTPISNAILLVEDALVDSYKAVSPWCYFGEIKGFNEVSGIDTIFAGQQKDAIYSLGGQKLDVPRKGINIIKTNQGVKKVMVN